MKKYFYSNGKEKFGPFSFEDLTQEGITKDTLIWFEGLNDWTPAHELTEIIPILEVLPPPVLDVAPKEVIKNVQPTDLKEASDGWVIAGFIFSFLGGIFGIGIGANYAFGKYPSNIKTLGWFMMIIGFVFAVIWRVMREI